MQFFITTPIESLPDWVWSCATSTIENTREGSSSSPGQFVEKGLSNLEYRTVTAITHNV